jgi:SAM-dependent methyltransferase
MPNEAQQIIAENAPTSEVAFVCPSCRGALLESKSSYHCETCALDYPILFGIPDFRLRPDRYLTLEEERAKATRLHEFGKNASLAELVRFYYSITYDLPPNLTARYQAAILAAPARSEHICTDLKPSPESDIVADFGCGTGGFLLAAQGHYRAIYGIDIALRWLVICQKRLHDTQATARLVCADAEALPFPDRCFSQGIAADLVEHVYDIDRTLAEIGRTLKPGAPLWLSAANRFCPGPHPLTGVWATGLLPRRPRAWLLTTLKGIDLLRFANLVSPRDIMRRLRRQGYEIVQGNAKGIYDSVGDGYATTERGLIALYRLALRMPGMKRLLFWIGPAFEIMSRRSAPDSRGVGGGSEEE